MINPEPVLEKARRVFCGCDELEHRWWLDAICDVVPDCDGGLVVEVGAMRGGGTTTMAHAARERGFHVVSIDTWRTDVAKDRDYCLYEQERKGCSLFAEWVDQVCFAGVRDDVTPIPQDSLVVAELALIPPKIVFLWIDGWHGYPQAREEFRAFAPLVVPGGIVGFHDAASDAESLRIINYLGSEVPKCLDEMEQARDFDGWVELMLPACNPRDEKLYGKVSMECGWRTRGWRKLS